MICYLHTYVFRLLVHIILLLAPTGYYKQGIFYWQVIDPMAPRYMSVESHRTVPVLVAGAVESELRVGKHPKNPEVGEKTVYVGPRLLIDYEDAEALKENENSTFINWGNLLITKINQ